MIHKYLDFLEATGKSPNTIKTYRTQLSSFFQWLGSNGGDVEQITSIDAVQYRGHLQAKGQQPKSINTALASIEAYCKWLNEEGRLDHNPLHRVKRVAQVEEPIRWLTKNEKYRVIRAALREKSKRNTAIILALIMTGARVSELVNIKPDDVAISERKGTVVLCGKGNKVRTVPLPKELRDCLAEYLVERKATSRWLFDSQRGEQLTDVGVRHLCTKIGKATDVEGLTPHMFRHTYCHDLIEQGVSLHLVAKLAGHANISTTTRYVTPSRDELQEAVDLLSFT